ncbi:arylsulfatase A-like enzyme [Tepidamorphus gemmatus]|uniref:Arylsulfatase A-like enzyme n=1 Tax=Tepidamorphus gemmatus TaxID=747076 RepID=A0A4R3M6V3_9HYPH|nr:alkaline phosphatase family protein [Tepidamorphus gemmatus]TCT09161.1 arylsulfatase A-like enzyme [Tepidamorphus gemmatus]
MTNILLITADQWRGDTFGAAGHPVVRTPNIDRLAGEGVRFARHFGQAAPCSPARACLYTGLYQMTNRVCRNGTPLDRRHDTLALAMRRAGYDPTQFGYTDVSLDPRDRSGRDPALTTYESVLPGMSVRVLLPEHARPWLSWLRGRGVEVPAGLDIYLPRNAPADPPAGAAPVYGPDETETAFLTNEFLRWLWEQDGPWFAHVSFLRPHPPFIVPEPYASMYPPEAATVFVRQPTAAEAAALHPFLAYSLASIRKGSFVYGAEGLISEWDDAARRQIRATYWGMVSEVDAQIGRILDGLDEAGAAADTMVILTSDHGEMLGDQWLFGKLGWFDASYHVPLIIRDPKTTAGGTVVESFTESIDIMPTILERIGAEVPDHLDGRSLMPFLRGETPPGWRAEAHWEFDFREVATGETEAAFGLPLDALNLAVIRSERYKYVHFAGLPPLLFDLEREPGELVDRANDPAYAAIRLEMAEKLLAWRARHLDRRLSGIELTEGGPVSAGLHRRVG